MPYERTPDDDLADARDRGEIRPKFNVAEQSMMIRRMRDALTSALVAVEDETALSYLDEIDRHLKGLERAWRTHEREGLVPLVANW